MKKSEILKLKFGDLLDYNGYIFAFKFYAFDECVVITGLTQDYIVDRRKLKLAKNTTINEVHYE